MRSQTDRRHRQTARRSHPSTPHHWAWITPHDRIAQAAHIIRRIPSQQERERIMQQLEEDGDFTAEGIEAVRRAVG